MTAKQIRYIARILFLLYVGYYSCVSYFIHTDVYAGVVYLHSHPYNKQEKTSSENDRPPFETHTHNAAGFFAINQMSNAISYEASINNIISDLDVVVQTIPYNIVEDQKAVRGSIRLFNLRAPPII